MSESIEFDRIDLKAVSELDGLTFHIPSQQRGYKWTSENVTELLDDLLDFEINSSQKLYCMQPLALVECNENEFELLDGQQRLTTIYLIKKYLELSDEEMYALKFERDGNEAGFDAARTSFLEGTINEISEENIDFYYISNAYRTIRRWFENSLVDDKNEHIDSLWKQQGIESMEKCRNRFKELLSRPSGEKSVQFIWYIINKDQKHAIFRNLNSGKIPLTNAELIKALLLSDKSPIKDKALCAAQYDAMAIELGNDRFWSMFQQNDSVYRTSRLDFIFNLAAGVSADDINVDPLVSFRIFSKGNLLELWDTCRNYFIRLKDLYDNPYTYHYIGFLTFCGKYGITGRFIDELLKRNKKGCIEFLRKRIRTLMNKNNDIAIGHIKYGMPVAELRRWMVLYNIETLLQRYQLNNDSKIMLPFEVFPFDLLYKQSWDIEHVGSQTDSKLDKLEDQIVWVDNLRYIDEIRKKDSPDSVKYRDDIQEAVDKFLKDNKTESFKTLWSLVNTFIDEQLGDEKIIDKDLVGNLVLLDSTTNRSYKNALFPRKRLYIIAADGNKGEDESLKNIANVYIPICTKQVFMKYYSKKNYINYGAWTKSDSEAYMKDFADKLKYYLQSETL